MNRRSCSPILQAGTHARGRARNREDDTCARSRSKKTTVARVGRGCTGRPNARHRQVFDLTNARVRKDSGLPGRWPNVFALVDGQPRPRGRRCARAMAGDEGPDRAGPPDRCRRRFWSPLKIIWSGRHLSWLPEAPAGVPSPITSSAQLPARTRRSRSSAQPDAIGSASTRRRCRAGAGAAARCRRCLRRRPRT